MNNATMELQSTLRRTGTASIVAISLGCRRTGESVSQRAEEAPKHCCRYPSKLRRVFARCLN